MSFSATDDLSSSSETFLLKVFSSLRLLKLCGVLEAAFAFPGRVLPFEEDDEEDEDEDEPEYHVHHINHDAYTINKHSSPTAKNIKGTYKLETDVREEKSIKAMTDANTPVASKMS